MSSVDSPSDRDRGERRAHARELAVGRRLLEHGRVREHDRGVERLPARDRGAQRLERGRARDLAGAVAAHAVGDGVEREPVVDDEAVFVDRAQPPDVGARADVDPHAASPFVTASPRARSGRPGCGRPCAACTPRSSGAPLTRVPFVEPRSSTNTSPSRSKTRACTFETNVSSGSEIPQPARAADRELTVHVEGAAARGGRLDDEQAPRPARRLRPWPAAGAGCGTGAAASGAPRSSDTTVHTTRARKR